MTTSDFSLAATNNAAAEGRVTHYTRVFVSEQLRVIQLRQAVRRWLPLFSFPARHHANISLVAIEMCSNALEHGLLGLDSNLKDQVGWDAYAALYERRLQQLRNGHIVIRIAYQAHKTKHQVACTVADTGKGFDTTQRRVQTPSDQRLGGRGIALLHGLCSRVDFNERGNIATALYEWEDENYFAPAFRSEL